MTELKNELLASFGRALATYGFNRDPKCQSYYRSFDDGWACVHLAIIDHGEEFDVTMDVAIRFDSVEELVNVDNKLLTRKEKESTATLGIEIGNLSIGKQRRWKLAYDEDLQPVIESMLKAYRDYGHPYLKKYTNPEAALELLSSDNEEVFLHSPIHATRTKRAIALAKVLGCTDLKKRIDKNIEFLEKRNDLGLSDFRSFADHLS